MRRTVGETVPGVAVVVRWSSRPHGSKEELNVLPTDTSPVDKNKCATVARDVFRCLQELSIDRALPLLVRCLVAGLETAALLEYLLGKYV